MDSREPLQYDAPLSITRTFLRQAAALGLSELAAAHCAPLASMVSPSTCGCPYRATDPESGRDPLPLACRLDHTPRSRVNSD